MKGVNSFNGGQPATWVESNLSVEKGWVISSSKRQDYLFPQLDRDTDPGGKELYTQLNNLGARPCGLRPRMSWPRTWPER